MTDVTGESAPLLARAHASREVVAAKHKRLGEPHVAPLVGFADEMARVRGIAPGDVPYPDPDSGGVHARVLWLLSTPGNRAQAGSGSGLLSIYNDDLTAARCYHTMTGAGLAYAQCLAWNAVPWPTAGRTPTNAEQAAARPWLMPLLDLLPELRVVLLLGRIAQETWRRAVPVPPEGVTLLAGPHPSPLAMNRYPDAPDRLAAVVGRAARIAHKEVEDDA